MFFKVCLSSLALAVALLTAPVADAVAAGTDAELSQPVLQSFLDKMDDARRVERSIRTRLQCVEEEHRARMEKSQALETALGESRRREKELVSQNAEFEERVRRFSEERDRQQKAFQTVQAEWRRLEAEKRRQEQDVQHCKSQWWTINALCDLAADFLRAVGEFEEVDGRLAGVRVRLETARQSLNMAQNNLNQSRATLRDVRGQIGVVNRQIAETEQALVDIKASLAQLRIEEQSFNTEIADLKWAISEAQSVDTEDEKRRTLRKMQRISESLDALIARSAGVIEKANALLASSGRICTAG